MTVKKNASVEPKVWYGLHMCEGVAEYNEDGEASRIFINEDTLRRMDPTLAARPVYVHHQDVNLKTIQADADGWVSESFFNEADAKHWCRFIVVSDKGHEAIAKGWRLSNAYQIEDSGPGGRWHNVEYEQEVKRGRYLHLAIVGNPRYEESIILSPEEFRAYNEKKRKELKNLVNAKEEKKKMGFKLWSLKKEEVQNADDIANAVVGLEDGTEMPLAEIVKFVSAAQKKENEQKINMGSKIKVGNEQMTVKDLVNAYEALKKNAAKDDDGDEDDKENDEDEEEGDEKDEKDEKKEKKNKKKKNAAEGKPAAKKPVKKNDQDDDSFESGLEAADQAEDEVENEGDEEEESDHFEALKNAKEQVASDELNVISTPSDRKARGMKMFGG